MRRSLPPDQKIRVNLQGINGERGNLQDGNETFTPKYRVGLYSGLGDLRNGGGRKIFIFVGLAIAACVYSDRGGYPIPLVGT